MFYQSSGAAKRSERPSDEEDVLLPLVARSEKSFCRQKVRNSFVDGGDNESEGSVGACRSLLSYQQPDNCRKLLPVAALLKNCSKKIMSLSRTPKPIKKLSSYVNRRIGDATSDKRRKEELV